MGFLGALGLRWVGWGHQNVREAVTPDDDSGWVRASLAGGTALNPDRDDLNGEALLRAAFSAYQHNPIAYAIVEQTTSFVLGGGAKVVAEEPRVQKLIDAFWNDKENCMALRVYSIQTELSLFGEQFIRFFVDRLTGEVVVRQMDPLYVTEIETDPDDVEKPLRYLWQPPSGVLGAAPPVEPQARINSNQLGGPGEDTVHGQLWTGSTTGAWIDARDVLHVAVNKASSALRGRSDLAPVLKWLRKYSKWLDDRVVINELKSGLVWDVTVAGAGVSEINAMRARHASPPPRGSVLFHNESETWRPVKPEIAAGDASDDGRAIRLMIATGALLPEHYLGEGGNANRATAAEMGLPAIKRFQRRQQVFRALLEAIVERVLDEALRVGRLGPRVNRRFAVQFEELTTSPLESVAAAVKGLTDALAIASEKGWVTAEEARKFWFRYAAQADESVPQGEAAA